jgi:hypothetical protein
MMKKVLVFDTEEDSKLVSFSTCSCAHAFPEFSSHFIDWQNSDALFGIFALWKNDWNVVRSWCSKARSK